MSNASTYLGGGSAIKSVQRGVISSASQVATAAITAVDTSRAVVSLTDYDPGYQGGFYYPYSVELTDSTTVTRRTTYPGNLSTPTAAAWEVVEYAQAVKSIQHKTVAMGAIYNNMYVDATITAVDPAKSILVFRGYQSGGSNASYNLVIGMSLKAYLTSGTNLRVWNRAESQTPNNPNAIFTIVEFF